MSAPVDKDEYGKDVTASEQYQEKLKTYQTCKGDVCTLTLLSCMHDDLLGEFKRCPTAKDTWDRLKIQFDQTSATRLCTFPLKWMEFKLDVCQPMIEQLQTMSGIVRDLNVAGQDIPEEEQALNVI